MIPAIIGESFIDGTHLSERKEVEKQVEGDKFLEEDIAGFIKAER